MGILLPVDGLSRMILPGPGFRVHYTNNNIHMVGVANQATLRLIPHPWERRVLPVSGTINVAIIVKKGTYETYFFHYFCTMQRQTIFNNLQTDEQRELFQKAFPPAKKKKSKASELTDAIISYIKMTGGAARSINNSVPYDKNKGVYLSGIVRRGTEDITCTMPIVFSGVKIGLHVGVEVKIGKDRQSEYQKRREEELTKAGGVYIIAKTFDQFKQDWDNIKHRYEYNR